MLSNCGAGGDSSRVPWTAKRSNQSILKEIGPEWSLGGLMLKLKLQYLATWCEELTHLKSPWCWEGLGAGGEGDDSGWDGWMAALTRCTWVWVDSGSQWSAGSLACPSSWGRKESDTTEGLNWTELNWMALIHCQTLTSTCQGALRNPSVFRICKSPRGTCLKKVWYKKLGGAQKIN